MMGIGYWILVAAGLFALVVGLDQLFAYFTDRRGSDADNVRSFEAARDAHRRRQRRESRWYEIDDEAGL